MAIRSFKELSSLKKRYIAIISSIIAIMALVVVASITYSRMQRGGQVISEVLADQRVLVKTMMSDANRMSVIYSAIESGEAVSDRNRLETKLVNTRQDLEMAVVDYDKNLENILAGRVENKYGEFTIWTRNMKVMQGQIEENSRIWLEQKERYETIISSDVDSREFLEALVYVNENTENLIRETTALAEIFSNINVEAYSDYNRVISIIVGLVGILILFTLYEFYKYLFLPLGELYTGFKKMGFDTLTEAKGAGVKSVTNEIKEIMDGIMRSMELTEDLNGSMSFDESLNHIYESFKGYIPYSYIGIALFKNTEDDTIVGSYGIGNERITNDLMADIIGYEVSAGETSLIDIVKTGEPRVINDLESHVEGEYRRKYNDIILKAGVRSSITLPLIAGNRCIGFIFFSSDKKNIYNDRHIKFLSLLGSSISIAFQKNIFIEDLLYSSLLALTKISEEKDQDTGEHLVRMREYSTKLTKLMKRDSRFKHRIDSKFVIDIEKFSPMHDIGKVGIPDRILLKPGKLSYDEFEVMKTHTTNGAKVLREAENNIKRSGKSMFEMGIDIAETHHEKWDGSGYPKGLKGSEIPLAGRIVALADVLDALLTRRPYKEPFSFERAMEIIHEGKGNHFDPDIVEIFEDNIDSFKYIYNKSLNGKLK